jgi:hypothetical protein
MICFTEGSIRCLFCFMQVVFIEEDRGSIQQHDELVWSN